MTFWDKVQLTINMWEQAMLSAQREFYREVRRYTT